MSKQPKQHKIIIGGVGRTRSTTLMCLLSYLELGTGFGKESYKNPNISQTFFLEGRGEAYIFKALENAGLVPERFDNYEIDCFIWLKRNYTEASESRIKRHNLGWSQGGLTADTEWKPERLLAILIKKDRDLGKYLVDNKINYVEILFNKFLEFEYLYEKLLVPFPHLKKDALKEAFDLIVKPELVTK